MNWPKISIVTPSFNQGEFIEQTINSVIKQNYPNLEYIIMDGGSTDGTVEIIRKHETHITHWESAPDKGQSDAIKKGFARASGEVLGWLNSDDVYLPGALEKIARAYLACPIASIYAGGLCYSDANGLILRCYSPTLSPKYLLQYGVVGLWQPSSFFNAYDYKKIGGINSNLYFRMDGDLIYRLLKHNPVVKKIDDMISLFRAHANSKTSLRLDVHEKEVNEFIEQINMSKNKFKILLFVFKIFRLLSTGYLKSYLASRRYRGKNISSLWQQMQ